MGLKAAAAVGLKPDRLRLPSVAAVARSRVMRLWLLRATTTVLLWTCVVQLTAVGETWGPRVLRGWPSCRMAPEARRQLAVPGTVVDKEAALLPHKSECCCYSVSFTIVVPRVPISICFTIIGRWIIQSPFLGFEFDIVRHNFQPYDSFDS
jgi:hypothetical protein